MAKRIGVLVAILFLLAASPVQAGKPLAHEHYSGTDIFDFDDCGIPIHVVSNFSGLFMLKPDPQGGPPRLSDNYNTHEVLSSGDKWFTIDHNGLYKDVKTTLVSGTIYQFDTHESGQPFTVRDMNGNLVSRDRGLLHTRFLVDTKGDNDLDNDVFIEGSFSIVKDAGSHPAFYQDFCTEIAVLLLT